MFAQRCSITAPVPRSWAWTALTDAQNLARWSPIGDCDFSDVESLSVGDEIGCTVQMLGRPVGATLCVIDLQKDRRVALRIETLAATVFESVELSARGATETDVDYEFDVISPVAGPALEAWFRAHARATCEGLSEYLQPAGGGLSDEEPDDSEATVTRITSSR